MVNQDYYSGINITSYVYRSSKNLVCSILKMRPIHHVYVPSSKLEKGGEKNHGRTSLVIQWDSAFPMQGAAKVSFLVRELDSTCHN